MAKPKFILEYFSQGKWRKWGECATREEAEEKVASRKNLIALCRVVERGPSGPVSQGKGEQR